MTEKVKRCAGKTAIKIASVSATLIIVICSCFLLTGCGLLTKLFGGKVDFTRTQLTMEVGEKYDVSEIISSSSFSYTVRSSKPTVASVAGTVVTAKKAGTVKLTASVNDYSSELTLVVVEYAEDGLFLDADGELLQTEGETAPVYFKATATGSIGNKLVSWYVNDEKQNELYPETPFVFDESAIGMYEVRAECGGFSQTQYVRIYRPVIASGDVTGEINQSSSPYEKLILSADISKSSDNPADIVQWFVDGETVYEGTGDRFDYSPVAGQHTLTLKVNGVDRSIGGKPFVTLFMVGSVIPTTIRLDYDNLYPHAYFVYDAEGMAAVEITAPGGIVNEYSQADARFSQLFTDNGFDVGGLINIAATNTVRQSYKLRVKSLGDGGALVASEYCEPYTFTQLPKSAGEYLRARYVDKDCYITSEEEYVNLFEYNVLFRNKSAKKPKVSFDCYIGFDYGGSADDLFQDAFELAATSGSYDGIKTSMRSNIMHTEFTVNTVNSPTKQTKTKNNAGDYTAQLHAILPHINYDQSKYRDEDYVFPIDKLANTQSVTYSDELYFVAENNARPLPVKSSSAEKLYDMARDVLRRIVTDDMTDAQKAHAIYDWIMWQVTYDSPATEIDKGGEAYSAYYMEGVFGDGETSIGGVKYSPYAVCDGMSKAYSLMCNIEGIPCVRVAGTAGMGRDAGGHAWNKVRIDGEWYIVDCTWGDAFTMLDITGVRRNYELGIHDWLFKTDDEAASTHFEPYMNGESGIVTAPETSAEAIDVYSNMEYFGNPINCKVSVGERQSDRIAEICCEFARGYTKRNTVYIPGGANNGVYPVTYEGLDIFVEGGFNGNVSTVQFAVRNEIRSIIRDKLGSTANVDVKMYEMNDVILFLMRVY